MKKKHLFYTELAYLPGLILLAIGAAMVAKSDFGMSMVVAPAYLLHLKLSQTLPFFSFGMAEYVLQAVLLILLALAMRRFKLAYLLSFVTAVLYGAFLDVSLMLLSLPDLSLLSVRLLYYVLGILCTAFGISLVFHTYIPPEAYEQVVKDLSAKFGFNINKCKTCYDCISLVVSVALSFCFYGFGHFEAIKWGTLGCALLTGSIVGMFSRFLEKHFVFQDRWPYRRLFV